MQEIEVWPYEEMVFAQPIICPGEWDAQNPLGFWDTNGSPNLGQTQNLIIINKKERTCRIMNFAIPVENRVKLKEREKKDKYLVGELKKMWNMKVKIIPIVIGALGTVT